MDFLLNNSWSITIIGGIVVGLVLYFIFGIGKKSKDKPRKRIGILNQGENNTFINNTFEGLDVGIKDQGKNTKATGNRFN